MIKNWSKKAVLAHNKEISKNLFSQGLGLMFSLPKKDFGLIFEFKEERFVPLTMLFVFYPIDILWLDAKKRVVDSREKALPFTPNIAPSKKSKFVVELPRGTIKKSGTKIGDVIKF